MNEADTCWTYIVPNLKSAGWEDETISEQLVLTQRIYLYVQLLGRGHGEQQIDLNQSFKGYGGRK
jgi:hypothetical protein